MIAFILAQMLPTPVPMATPTPAPISERTVLARGIDDAAAQAKALGGTLGAVIIDLATGSIATRDADQAHPMQSVQKLPLAVLVYASIDGGKLTEDTPVTIEPQDIVHTVSSVAENYPSKSGYTVAELTALMLEQSDNTAAKALLRVLGGVDAVNARLRDMNLAGILVADDDNGFAKPAALASLLSDLENGKILSASSRATVLGMLEKSMTFPGRLRAGFPPGTVVQHKTGTSGTTAGVTDATNDVAIVNVNGRSLVIVAMLSGAHGDASARDAVIAAVARAAYQATQQFPV